MGFGVAVKISDTGFVKLLFGLRPTITQDVGFSMIGNVGINMTWNVGMNMTSNARPMTPNARPMTPNVQ